MSLSIFSYKIFPLNINISSVINVFIIPTPPLSFCIFVINHSTAINEKCISLIWIICFFKIQKIKLKKLNAWTNALNVNVLYLCLTNKTNLYSQWQKVRCAKLNFNLTNVIVLSWGLTLTWVISFIYLIKSIFGIKLKKITELELELN